LLTNLTIKNYALIDDITVSFGEGLSTITGETGAGKSILLGGLGLILGKRADLSAVNQKDRKCIVEAEFNITNYSLQHLFKKEALDYDATTIMRREILPSGKSRAFINDSPVSLASLKLIGEQLIDIHSQHQTLQLTDAAFQFEVIDALAKNEKNVTRFKKSYAEFKSLQKVLLELTDLQTKANKNDDYTIFLLNELKEAKLETIQQEALESELEQLQHIEEIQLALLTANQLLSDEQVGITSLMVSLKNTMRAISSYSPSYETLFNRIQSAHIELDDVFSEIEMKQEQVEANPMRVAAITSILNTINSLYQKHQVQTITELLTIEKQLGHAVNSKENLEETIAEKHRQIAEQKAVLDSLAETIHQKRLAAIPKLIKQLEKIVINLGMENAKFKITLESKDCFFENGKDELDFLFSANKGGQFNTLKKAASGGELSRIMLGIKAILSKYKQLPSIMFDEIDTGVSGDVATKMGLLMEYMSEAMQVFSITHLPQIASKGFGHFKVYKQDDKGVTKTQLKRLTQDERIEEIAEMLGGKNKTETAREHAKELLNI
jgi:DNA repair protein RecN (Recombination protein N)